VRSYANSRDVLFSLIQWPGVPSGQLTVSVPLPIIRRQSDSVGDTWGAARTVMGRARDGTVRRH